MRILWIQETDWIRRNPIHHHHILERLSLWGHDIKVIDYEILWRFDGKNGRRLFQPGLVFNKVSKLIPGASIDVIRPYMVCIPGVSRLTWFAGNCVELMKLFRDWRPSVVAGYGVSNGLLALKLAGRFNCSYVHFCMEPTYRMSPPVARSLAFQFEQRIFRQAQKVVVINNRLVDYAKRMGAGEQKISILKAGMEPFWKTRPGRDQIRRSLGLGEKDRIILFAGWLYSHSGLLEVCRSLESRGSDLKLVIIGEGDIYRDLQEFAARNNNIVLLGQQPHTKAVDFICASDLCILPSQDTPVTRDIVPMKVNEYLGAGKPVVSTGLSGVTGEFGTDSGVIYCKEPGDVVDTAAYLLDNPVLYQLYSRQARDYTTASGTWDDVAEKFGTILYDQIQAHA